MSLFIWLTSLSSALSFTTLILVCIACSLIGVVYIESSIVLFYADEFHLRGLLLCFEQT